MRGASEKRTASRKSRRALSRGVFRWLFRAALAFLVAVLGFLLAVPYISNSGLVKGFVSQMLSDRLNGALVRLESLKLSPFETQVLVLKGLQLSPPGGQGGAVVTIGELSCTWLPWRLRDGRLELARVRGSSVNVSLREEGGKWNVLSLVPPKAKPGRLPFSVHLSDLALEGVEVELVRETGETVRMHGISLDFEGQLDGRLDGTARFWMSAKQLSASIPGMVSFASKEGLTARVSLERNEGTHVRLSGAFELASLAIDLGKLGSLEPVDVSGSLACGADLEKRSLSGLEVAVELGEVAEARFSAAFDPQARFPAQGTGYLRADLAAVQRVFSGVRFPALGAFSAKGTLTVASKVCAKVQKGPQRQVSAFMENVVLGERVSARATLQVPQRMGPFPAVHALVDGLDFRLKQTVNAVLGGELSGSVVLSAIGSAESLEARAGEPGGVRAEQLSGSAQAAVDLNRLRHVVLSGEVLTDSMAVRGEKLAGIEMPVDFSFRIGARNLLDGERATLVVDQLSAGFGGALPWLWASAVVKNRGKGSFRAGSRALVGIDKALALAKSLPGDIPELLGQVHASGIAVAAAEVAGRLPFGSDGGPLELAATGCVDAAEARLGGDGTDARAKRALCNFACAVESGNAANSQEAAVALTLGGDGLEVSDVADVEEVELALAAETAGREFRNIGAGFWISGRGITSKLLQEGRGDARVPTSLDISFDGEGRMDTQQGDVVIESLQLSAPPALELRLPRFSMNALGGKGLAGVAEIEMADLEALLSQLPASLLKKLPRLSGSLAARGSFEGEAPLVARLVQALKHKRAMPSIELFPLSEFYAEDLPLSADLRVSGRDISLDWPIGAAGGVKLEGLSTNATIALKQGALSGRFSADIGSFAFPRVPVPLESLHVRSDFSAHEFDTLQMDGFHLDGLDDCLAVDLAKIRAAGLSRFAEKPAPGSVLQALDLDVDGAASLDLGRCKFLEGLGCKGTALWRFEAELRGGRSLSLSASGSFGNISASRPGLFAGEGIGGRLLFSKKWSILLPQQREGKRRMGLSERVLGNDALREGPGPAEEPLPVPVYRLVETQDNLSMRSLRLMGKRVAEDVRLKVRVADGALRFSDIRMRLLGGRLVGNVCVVQSDDVLEFRADSEFEGLDFRRLLPGQFKDVKASTSVSGNLRVRGTLDPVAPSPLGEARVTMDITHIGSQALDRLLLMLDPGGQKPSIVQIRSRLKLASPSRVLVKLRRGFIGIDVELHGLVGGLISRYSVPRFNVGPKLSEEPLKSALERFSGTARLVLRRFLGSERIEIDEEGAAIRFRP